MNDQLLWELGLKRVNQLLANLTEDQKKCLMALLSDYRNIKEVIASFSQSVDSESICRECAGQCCMNGKYRTNLLDTISIIEAEVAFLPDFHKKPLCPYSTVDVCSASPQFRPADCILFICDEIDLLLSEQAKSELAKYERLLKQHLQTASRLLDVPASTPLLLWAEMPQSLKPKRFKDVCI